MIFKFCQVVSHDDLGKATMHQQALMFECGLCLLVSVSTLYSKGEIQFDSHIKKLRLEDLGNH
ncbi:hypothetical protein T4D_17040 [Trichinella pseudospiralis]|uniref:Uncharacterized protein n=1 Tax=Trichinella pseudospiralis TaxID=6337 RepID=A0A0V1F878_TRIPS|nr:hypothetical protein T4D_17040 [Trichinella pseudospiralis]